MLGLTKLHEFAARRGEGLRPELLELLTDRPSAFEGGRNKVELAANRNDDFVQAGPNHGRSVPAKGRANGLWPVSSPPPTA